MREIKYIYKVVQSLKELESTLNTENTNKLLANVLELGQGYVWFLIIWEE